MASAVQEVKLGPSRDIPFNKLVLDLADGVQGRRVRVIGVNLIEVTDFTDTMRDPSRLLGAIISWKLRFFFPVDETGPAILAKALDCYPIARVADRAAA